MRDFGMQSAMSTPPLRLLRPHDQKLGPDCDRRRRKMAVSQRLYCRAAKCGARFRDRLSVAMGERKPAFATPLDPALRSEPPRNDGLRNSDGDQELDQPASVHQFKYQGELPWRHQTFRRTRCS